MSIIKDTFFGGAEKKAARAQEQGIERGIEATQEAARRAENFAFPLFNAAQQNAQQGFQGGLNALGQSLPAQTDVFTQGNVGAQQQILQGLPQIQNALMGNQVDFSQLQPFQAQQPDLSFFQQQLPTTVNPFAPQTNQQIGVGGVLPPNDLFTGPLQNVNQDFGGFAGLLSNFNRNI